MLDAPQPIEQRVFGVGVEVDKTFRHDDSRWCKPRMVGVLLG
jgi:hypothetical protein